MFRLRNDQSGGRAATQGRDAQHPVMPQSQPARIGAAIESCLH
jgi:hypothetical protein